MLLTYVDSLDLFRGRDRRWARCRRKEGGSLRSFYWSSRCRVNFINNIKRKTYESWTRAVEWIEFGFRWKRKRGLSVSDSFERIGVCCFNFLLLFPFAYGFVRIHARTWDMRKRRTEERNENKDQPKKKKKFKVQSIYDRNAIQWYSCWGRKREQQYDKPKIILFYFTLYLFELPFRVSCQRWVIHHDPVITPWLPLSLILLLCLPVLFLSTILLFSLWTSIFPRSLSFLFAPRPTDSSNNVCKSPFFYFLYFPYNNSLSLYNTIDQSIQYIATAIANMIIPWFALPT